MNTYTQIIYAIAIASFMAGIAATLAYIALSIWWRDRGDYIAKAPDSVNNAIAIGASPMRQERPKLVSVEVHEAEKSTFYRQTGK